MADDHVQRFINSMASGNDPLGIIDSIIREDIRQQQEEDRLIRSAILLALREHQAELEALGEEEDEEDETDEDGDEDETTGSSESASQFATLETPTPMPGHPRSRPPARQSSQLSARAPARVLSGMPPPTRERVPSTMPPPMVDSWVSSQRQLLSQSQARARTQAPSQSQPQPQSQSQSRPQSQTQPQSQQQAASQQPSRTMAQPQSQFQLGALDRRAMEQERLERLAKQKRSPAVKDEDKDTDDDVVEIPPSNRQSTASMPEVKGESTSDPEQHRSGRPAKRQRSPAVKNEDNDTGDDVVEIPPPKRQATTSTSAAKGKESKMTKSMPAPASASLAAPNSSLPYPNGTVKRTWARGLARTGDDITIEEVFQKDQLELALLSSFQWDEEWMLSKLDISKTKLLLLAFAKDEAQKNQMRGNVPANIKFCFPPMYGVGAMHSKLQLLKYPNRLRVVIPTGNLVPYDWGETGVMENMVFLIDLPRLENPATTPQSPTAFYTELVYFLQATGVGDKMVASLSNYDFSKTSDIAFVHTIPGSHTGKAAERTGYCGLGASVAALGLATSSPIEVDLLCASLGALTHEFIEAIYSACRGRDGIEDFKSKSGGTSSRSKAAKRPDEAALKELQERFRIYFPTERTVAGSRGGRNAGGTICVQAKWWRSPTFPTELVRDVIARDRLLVHSKMIFVRRVGHDQTTAQHRPGWAYVGSANLSESAWGRLSKDRSTKAIKINCRNWECGVILPVPESKAVDKTRASSDMAMFAGTVPVPMQVPGPAYASGDRPWFYTGA